MTSESRRTTAAEGLYCPLCLKEALPAKHFKQLLGALEEMYMHSGPETRLDIFPSVIDVEDLFGSDAGFTDGSPVDDGVGFAGTHGAGIDPSSEIAGETKGRFQVNHVDGVRIREQHQAVAEGKLLEEVLAEDGFRIERAVPRCAELLKRVREPQATREMRVPFAWRDPPLLPLAPPWIGFDRGPDPFGREVGAGAEHGQSAFQVDAHDYAPDVKDDCFNGPTGLRSLRACEGEFSHG